MASAPQSNLPLFFKDLMPLNSKDHANYRARPMSKAPWLVGQHAIPLTVDEFVSAQRDLPIVFSTGEDAVPLALMGLNEGVNTFVDDEGKVMDNLYLPAYIRRHPYMLARLKPDADEMSLCFDPTAENIGEFEDGEPLFEDGKPTEFTKQILEYCEQFEQAGQRTKAFMDELRQHDLLMDGEIAIQQQGNDKPFVYRGFQMINQDKLRELRGDQLRKWTESGLLPLIWAQIFSLDVMRTIFGRQLQQGKVPLGDAMTAGAPTI
ncbi:SapC family protein [Qipengyuania flava]|uniref:SapC family protein n=1 Tax=Qipengyuania flava TaxID=192812 RepID=UPI001C628B54|nr:SapC family protein [Qipengyuania flava]QYJ06353.1 SapC family protein [Qipengyuania flava]